jgi:hypothetical protein
MFLILFIRNNLFNHINTVLYTVAISLAQAFVLLRNIANLSLRRLLYPSTKQVSLLSIICKLQSKYTIIKLIFFTSYLTLLSLHYSVIVPILSLRPSVIAELEFLSECSEVRNSPSAIQATIKTRTLKLLLLFHCHSRTIPFPFTLSLLLYHSSWIADERSLRFDSTPFGSPKRTSSAMTEGW